MRIHILLLFSALTLLCTPSRAADDTIHQARSLFTNLRNNIEMLPFVFVATRTQVEQTLDDMQHRFEHIVAAEPEVSDPEAHAVIEHVITFYATCSQILLGTLKQHQVIHKQQMLDNLNEELSILLHQQAFSSLSPELAYDIAMLNGNMRNLLSPAFYREAPWWQRYWDATRNIYAQNPKRTIVLCALALGVGIVLYTQHTGTDAST